MKKNASKIGADIENFVKSESYNINGYERIGTVFNPISKLPKTVKR